MKFLFFLLFQLVCACNILQAQTNYFNKTQDVGSTFNAYSDIFLINQDTILSEGFLVDSTGKRFKLYSYIDINTGDTIKTFKYGRDTLDIYGGLTNNISIIDDFIYSCGVMYKDGIAYANFLKFDLFGNLIFDSIYNSTLLWSEFECLLPTDDGNFLLLGSKEEFFGNLDVWLVKMDPFGNILWEKTFDYSTYDGGVSIVNHLGNYLISAGKSDLITSAIDFWLICVDEAGDIIWEGTYGSEFYDGGNAISLENGDILINGSRAYASNYNESYVMRLDINGALIWQKSFLQSSFFNFPSSLGLSKEMQDGSIILAGTTTENNNAMNQPIGVIMKISESGDSIWARYLKIRDNDNYLTDLKLLENGDYLMAGYVFPDSPDNTEDGWIMRTNCLGYFEHPTDSVVFSGDGVLLNAQNLSAFYEYTTISWGDGEIDIVYQGDLQTINHLYPLPGNYTIETTTVACDDTIQKTIEYTANPPNLTGQNLSVFPNPNDGNFQVWLNSDEVFQMEVFDYNGRLVFTSSEVKLNTGYSLDLTSFDSAVYFLKASSSDNVFQSRIVITH